jgi:LmbE family N-acetylglucosaminyl deacetylase
MNKPRQSPPAIIRQLLILAVGAALTVLPAATAAQSGAKPADDGKLRIMVFGAHPDDAELKAGGVAAMWAARGHHVKFVSMTNGDLGHYELSGGALARRRKAEVETAAQRLGIQTEVMDIHDGELMPSLENRKKMVRLIREWRADVVMGHRPNDYNPDHRYVGVLMQDSAFMVTVPFYDLHTPPTEPNPVFLFLSDGFQKPNPFQADIVVAIDEGFQKKIDALDALPSQFYETVYGVDPKTRKERLAAIPKDAAGRRAYAEKRFGSVATGVAEKYRAQLVKRYGATQGQAVRYAEAFEICEYGRQPSEDEIRRLFPFFPAR